ncbi:MAG: hypothetical protein ACMXX6_01565 [Candidatus Woesearchaeota archaeon]
MRLKRIEKRKQRKKLIWGSVLSLIMVFGVAGFAFQGAVGGFNSFDYNGFTFRVQTDGQNQVYTTRIEGDTIHFYTDPFFSESRFTNMSIRSSLSSASTFTLAVEPYDTAAAGFDFNLYNILVQDIVDLSGIAVNVGFTDEYEGFPIYTCDDSSSENVVLIVPVNIRDDFISDGIFEVEENCFLLNGFNFDFVPIRDYLIYIARGII